MELILPYNTQDRDHFCNCALEVGFHEFVALKVIFTMKDSDLDIFQLMGRERLELLLYGWQVCQLYWDEQENKGSIPANLRTVLKQFVQYSLDIWFSKEWDECGPQLRAMLLVCLKRAKDVLVKLSGNELFDWDYTLQLGIKPWEMPYLKQFVVNSVDLTESLTDSSEHMEPQATPEDIKHLRKEGLFLLLLRLIKLFDAGTMEGVRRLSMRVIAAWNHEYEERKRRAPNEVDEIKDEHRKCLILICHLYLMAIYEMDNVRGFVIDNMLNNIRFYYQSMQEKCNDEDCSVNQQEFTPARYIAITCVNVGISSAEFFDAFIYDTYDENFVSLFGVISQSYMSYLLGNLLMEMNKMNEDDFKKYIEEFKRVIHLYIIERERSEVFILRELHKKEMQRRSHSLTLTKHNMTDFYSKICKGNRLSNIGSTEYIDSGDEKCTRTDEPNGRRCDPVFQHMPNNVDVLNYIYTLLVKRTHKGWYLAKLILLLKIIGLQLNAIETWRYHPGLTPEFMLNLEIKLSRHFEDLAIIFQENLFMEQEFWLTGFYLNPCKKYYETVIRSGMRSNRLSHRLETSDSWEDDEGHEAKRERRDKADKSDKTNVINAKYGLLSSTIDVKEIVKLVNPDTPEVDYGQLCNALRSFKLPEHTIKDLLTVIFLPRNKSFAWAVNWAELRKRCKNLVRNSEQKRHFVELNMAEANDKLKFLNVDYEKYKHRPQLDYGSIEEGYENVNMPNVSKESSDEDDGEDSEDFEADSDIDTPTKDTPKKDDHSQLFDSYFMSTRRTRARAAAVIATVLEKEETAPNGQSKEDGPRTLNDIKLESNKNFDCDEKIPATAKITRDFNEMLKERRTFSNSTSGFNPIPDIWSLNAQELNAVENNCVTHLETGSLLQKSTKLKILKIKNAELLRQQSLKEKTTQLDDTIQKGINGTGHMTSKNQKQNRMADILMSNNSRPRIAETNSRRVASTDCEMHDDESDVSTTARRDSEEINDFSKDEQMEQHLDQPVQPARTQSNIIAASKIVQKTATSCNDMRNYNVEGLAIASGTSVKSSKPPSVADTESYTSRESTENPNIARRNELLQLCAQKNLRVTLRRLTVADVQQLRQPRVCLQRVDMQTVADQMGNMRRTERKVYFDSDETSKSSSGSLYGERTLINKLKRRIYTSESSTESDDYKQRRRVGRPSRGRGQHPSGNSGIGSAHGRGGATSRRGCPKSLKITPRSASGLKFRISTNEMSSASTTLSSTSDVANVRAKRLPVIDYIQISSSSSSDDLETFGSLEIVQEEVDMDMNVDPLYEEEIPIFRL